MRAILCVVGVLLTVGAGAQPRGERETDPPLLTVTGDAEVRETPDEATVRLGVVSQAPTARAAQEGASDIVTRFLERIGELRIDRKNVQTSDLTLMPVYGRQRPGDENPPPIVAYRAQNTLAVRLTDLKLIGRVVDAGVAAGANNLEGVQFGLRDDGPARQRALAGAVAEARRKAATVAEALGVRLVSIHDVQEGGARIISPQPRPMMAREAMAAATPVEPGQLSLSASVTLRYVIAERAGR